MLKYVNTDVVFQEIPDEVTLAINISSCPCRCPGCHSSFLWDDRGEVLNEESIDKLIAECSDDISCVCFMGGDGDPQEVDRLAAYLRAAHKDKRIAWYSGRTLISSLIDRAHFDYIKVGPYIAHLGPLSSRTTNQHLFRLDHSLQQMEDITPRFWKH